MADGIVRARYHDGTGRATPITPGRGATATQRDFVVAEQAVCHDGGHPS